MLEQLFDNLNSKQEKICFGAIRQARDLSAEEILKLLEVYRKQQRVQWRRYNCLMISYICFMSLLVLHTSPRFAILLYGSKIFLILFSCVVLMLLAPSEARAADCLNQIITNHVQAGDMQFLLPALLFGKITGIKSKALREVLKKQLWLLRPHHVKNWTKEQKAALLAPLQGYDLDVSMTLSVLKALQQVGDEQALPFVKRLAALEAHTPDQWTIRLAAKDCLPYLNAHVAEARYEKTLLRPSGAVSAPQSEILLRAAEPSENTLPVEQLLRPTYGDK